MNKLHPNQIQEAENLRLDGSYQEHHDKIRSITYGGSEITEL